MCGLDVRCLGVALVAATLVLPVGCAPSGGSTNQPADAPPRIGSTDELRRRLEYIVESGVTGSGLAGIPEIIATLPQKESLEADYRKLEAATSAGQIKSVAKGMLEKL